jgi:hypothetical protein
MAVFTHVSSEIAFKVASFGFAIGYQFVHRASLPCPIYHVQRNYRITGLGHSLDNLACDHGGVVANDG